MIQLICMWTGSETTAILTCSVSVTVVVKTSSGYRLAAKQRIAVKVVAEFFQESEDVSDTADCGQGQGVLLLVKKGWMRHTGAKDGESDAPKSREHSFAWHNFSYHLDEPHAVKHFIKWLIVESTPEMTSPPCPDLRQEKTVPWLWAESTQAWTHCCSTEEARPGPKWSGSCWIRRWSRWGPTLPYLFRYTQTTGQTNANVTCKLANPLNHHTFPWLYAVFSDNKGILLINLWGR